MPCGCQDCRGGRLPGNLLTVRAQHRLPLAKQECGAARKGSHPVMKPDSHKPQRPLSQASLQGWKRNFHIWAPSRVVPWKRFSGPTRRWCYIRSEQPTGLPQGHGCSEHCLWSSIKYREKQTLTAALGKHQSPAFAWALKEIKLVEEAQQHHP